MTQLDWDQVEKAIEAKALECFEAYRQSLTNYDRLPEAVKGAIRSTYVVAWIDGWRRGFLKV